MKFLSAAIVLSAAVLGSVGCAGDADTTTTNGKTASNTAAVVNSNAAAPAANLNLSNATGRLNTTETFIPEAAIGGLAEIEMSKIAVGKAKNPEVKRFAQQMLAEHARANDELKALAAKKNVALPVELDAEHKSLAEKLKTLSGADFDRAYMAGQVADHERTVAIFQNQTDRGVDPETKAFAAKLLPNLKKHLETAAQLNKKLQ